MTATPRRRESAYRSVLAAGPGLLVGLDFDGTLAPIVDDPTQASIHPDAADVLVRLADQVAVIAIVTGRPVRQVLELGDLPGLANRIRPGGGMLVVRGQYGNEEWDSTDQQVRSPDPPSGLTSLMAELPALLADVDAADAWVEEKGLAVAVHTRRTADPVGTFDRILPALAAAAQHHGLTVEPGRQVVEVRAGGMDKGNAVRALQQRYAPTGVVFAGDDRGDVPAFEVVRAAREDGVPALLVCSGSTEEAVLADLADITVDGPDGVVQLLGELAEDLGALAGPDG